MKGRRTRIVQVVAGLATCALVGIAGFILPSRASLAAPWLQEEVQKKGQALPDGVRPEELSPPPVKENGLDPEPAPAAQPAAFIPDPEKDADDFVARTRKEAADRVAALDKEANDLRIRLAKVEAASAKLKAAFGVAGDPNLAPADPSNRGGKFEAPGPGQDVDQPEPVGLPKPPRPNPTADDPLAEPRPKR